MHYKCWTKARRVGGILQKIPFMPQIRCGAKVLNVRAKYPEITVLYMKTRIDRLEIGEEADINKD